MRDAALAQRQVHLVRSTRAIAPSAIVMWAGALLTIALHTGVSGLYGYQRDELYFIACANHLAWGYVDQPPLIALVVAVCRHVFGDSLAALRIVPALAAGALVGLTGYAAGRLGGGTYAAALAMLGVALAPFDLAVGSLLTMNAFEPLLWLALSLLVFDQLDGPRRWRWPAIGLLVGIGVLNKWSMGLYAFALLTGLLLSPARRSVWVPGLAVAGTLAALVATPNLIWQAAYGWPQLEVLRNAAAFKNEPLSPGLFLLEQLPLMNPFCAPLWLAGLWRLTRAPHYAGFAFAYAIFVGLQLLLHGKVYYVAPIYPAFIAAGCGALEAATQRRFGLRVASAGAIAVAGLAIMPLATPALPLPLFLKYQHALDVRAVKMEHRPVGLVPQQFADQLGWAELESSIGAAAARLSPRERESAAVLTGDYGQAAALDFLGRRDRLPPAISGHNQYYVWGPRGEHAAVVAVGVERAVLAREFGSIERVGTYRSIYVLPQSNNLPIYICRQPRMPLARFWPQLRRYV